MSTKFKAWCSEQYGPDYSSIVSIIIRCSGEENNCDWKSSYTFVSIKRMEYYIPLTNIHGIQNFYEIRQRLIVNASPAFCSNHILEQLMLGQIEVSQILLLIICMPLTAQIDSINQDVRIHNNTPSERKVSEVPPKKWTPALSAQQSVLPSLYKLSNPQKP